MAKRTLRAIYYQGIYWSMQSLAEHLGINYQTLNSRINTYGFPYKKSLIKKSLKEKPVLQIDKKTGEVIRRWNSTNEAARYFGIHYTGIARTLSPKYRQKSAAGFFWKFEKD